ncbi:ParA family protein [Paludisphaera mucosa]|uniref:ParA family protein n=1 Tax=Paludisphaera mucosa TaxID=3030827 RepID=A0ABT6FLB2_9BACT|nr:ParA family protein [Paludisphaera mucosa]MDG3008342.1 ParA family protein [Paludisphaera mucosa]
MRRIAFVNLKGGVGKSTCAATIAVGLAKRGRRVLLIDADAQGHATWTVTRGQGGGDVGLGEVLLRHAAAVDAIRPTPTEGLDVLPAGSSLGGANIALAQELGRDTRLRSALVDVRGYDEVLIDSGPSLNLSTINVLTAATEVVAPVDAAMYAVLGLVDLRRAVEEIRDAYNPGLRLAGLVLCKARKDATSRDVERQLRETFGGLVHKATIPLSAAIEAAHARGLTILDHAPKSPAATAFEALIDEVLSHGRSEETEHARRGPGAREDAA